MEAEQTAEQADLRATVARLAGKFGGTYYAARAQAHESCDELWQVSREMVLNYVGQHSLGLPRSY